ncbi:MAG: Asp-tRNA(Asn)/Glu-tRNA(Gln) amidotransferase subunit GatC [Clostridia bacterium]
MDVDKVATLSRLKLSTEEKEVTKNELTAIISFADQLSEIDTDGIDITAHVVPMFNVFREDTVTNKENRDELLQNAKTKENGYILVPKVFE